MSARLYDNNGLFDSQVNPDSYKMYNGRVKVGYQVTDWLKVTSNTSIAYSKYVMPETQSEGNGNIWRNIADEGHPCSPILNPDGTLSYSGVYSVGDILYGTSNRKYTNRQAENTIGAKATFLDNRLRFNADFTYRARAYDTHVHRLPTPFSPSAKPSAPTTMSPPTSMRSSRTASAATTSSSSSVTTTNARRSRARTPTTTACSPRTWTT